jgi:ubiquinone/menaquinone biosynthesis C-methylase UbiE
MTVEDIVDGVRSAYDEIAETYALANSGDMPGSLVGLGRKLCNHVGLGGHILDVGCGVGRDLQWFKARGAQVTGVDLSPAMLAQARRATHAPLYLMDMRCLAFQSASFDGAWCCASLLHLPTCEAPRALNEVRRILKPGGMLMVSLKEGDGEAWTGGYVEGVKRFFAYYRQPEMLTILANAGFAVRESADWASDSHGPWLSSLCIAT